MNPATLMYIIQALEAIPQLIAAGTNVMTLTFGRLQVPSNSPGVDGRRDVPLNLQMVSRRYSTTPSIAATLAT